MKGGFVSLTPVEKEGYEKGPWCEDFPASTLLATTAETPKAEVEQEKSLDMTQATQQQERQDPKERPAPKQRAKLFGCICRALAAFAATRVHGGMTPDRQAAMLSAGQARQRVSHERGI